MAVYKGITPEQIESILRERGLLEGESLYDIENVYVCQHSLDERSLPAKFNVENITTVDQQTFTKLLTKHDTIFRF